MLGVERHGHALQARRRTRRPSRSACRTGAAVALRGGLELGKGLLLSELAGGKLRQNVRVPLPVTDDGRYAGALREEPETGRVAVDIALLLHSKVVFRAAGRVTTGRSPVSFDPLAFSEIGQVPAKRGPRKTGKTTSRVRARLLAEKIISAPKWTLCRRPKRANSSRRRALARHDLTLAATPTFRALTHTRNVGNGNGNEREKSAEIGRKRANRPAGRNRPRRRGQNRAGCVATAVSTGNATIGRNAKNATLGALKSKSPHSTWTSEHSYTLSTIGP